MTAAEPYIRMALNNAWANETLFAAACKLSPTEFTAPRPGFFPALSLTLNHILEIDRYYLAALEGRPVPYAAIEAPPITDPATLAAAQGAEDRRLIALCRGLTVETLAQTRDTIRSGAPVPERMDALLLHLFQHQIHHRGQAHVQLQDAGIAPPQLDDFHLRFGRVPRAQAWLDG
jgi:uncharacterized damage-inducible protein DinB